MSQLSNVEKYGLNKKLLVDIMNLLKKKDCINFSVNENEIDAYMVIYNHVKWLNKHNCLVLSKILYADNRLWSFSVGQPDFEEFYKISKNNFNLMNNFNKFKTMINIAGSFINLYTIANEIINKIK